MIEEKVTEGLTIREVKNGFVVMPENDFSKRLEYNNVFVFNEFDKMVLHLKSYFEQTQTESVMA